mgnify:CR=1 FL=1
MRALPLLLALGLIVYCLIDAIQADPADQGVPVHRHRVLGDEAQSRLGYPDRPDRAVDPALEDVGTAFGASGGAHGVLSCGERIDQEYKGSLTNLSRQGG